jgi:tetratricopeptide (TPR) repeat protein
MTAIIPRIGKVSSCALALAAFAVSAPAARSEPSSRPEPPVHSTEVDDAYKARVLIATCVEATSVKSEERIAACSEVIKGNKQAAAEMALVYLNRAALYKTTGNQARATEDYAEALRRYDKLVNSDQPVAVVIYQRAVAHQALGLLDRAQSDYDEAIRLDPQNTIPLIERANMLATHKGELAPAIADFTRALALAPNNVDALLGRGDAYGRTGDFARSFADIDRAIVLAPGNAKAHIFRGLANARRGDSQSAATDYDAALKLDPRSTDALINRAALYSMNGQQERALADLNGAIAIRKNDPLAYFNRGYVHFSQRDYERAIDDYSEAIQIDPTMAVAYNNRCMVRALTGRDLPDAFRDCVKARDLTPNSIDVHDTLGLVSLKTGHPDIAVEAYNAALGLDPQHALSLYGRGLARVRIGETAGGNADRAAAAALKPDISRQFALYGLE